MIFQRIKDFFRGVSLGAVRSPRWPAVRKAFLELHPACAVCNSKRVAVHHIRPFHTNPEYELSFLNFITLCEGVGTANHHFSFGHLYSWRSWNVNVEEDAKLWYSKIVNKPKAAT